MNSDASDLLLRHVRQFTIGLALTDPPHPKVLGTAVLGEPERHPHLLPRRMRMLPDSPD